MQPVDVIGTWVVERMGSKRDVNARAGRWHKLPAEQERLELSEGGALVHHRHGAANAGAWRVEGAALVLERPPYETLRARLEGAYLEVCEPDEEHGGLSVLQFARPKAAASVDDVAARVSRSRDPRKLIEKEALVERALREGDVALLELCLAKGAWVYPVTLRRLAEASADALPALMGRLLAAPGVAPMLPQYVADEATPPVAEAFAKRATDAAAIARTVLAMFTGTYVRADRAEVLRALLAEAPALDVRDPRGIPLFVHAATKAPAEWVALLRPHVREPAAALEAPARLALDWGPIELPAGATAASAIELTLAALEARLAAHPGTAPVLRAERDRLLQVAAALCS